jgi:hypothetical protein
LCKAEFQQDEVVVRTHVDGKTLYPPVLGEVKATLDVCTVSPEVPGGNIAAVAKGDLATIPRLLGLKLLIDQIRLDKEAAIDAQDFERAAELRDNEKRLLTRHAEEEARLAAEAGTEVAAPGAPRPRKRIYERPSRPRVIQSLFKAWILGYLVVRRQATAKQIIAACPIATAEEVAYWILELEEDSRIEGTWARSLEPGVVEYYVRTLVKE